MAMELLILYGTQTGTAQEYAEQTAQEAFLRRIPYRVQSLAGVAEEGLDRYRETHLVLFFVATTGDGETPVAMRPFWLNLLRRDLPPTHLQGLRCAVMGLGDSSYEKFCFVGKRLYRRLEQLGAEFVGQGRADADEQHPLGLDGAYLPWIEAIWSFLSSTGGYSATRLFSPSAKVYLEPACPESYCPESAYPESHYSEPYCPESAYPESARPESAHSESAHSDASHPPRLLSAASSSLAVRVVENRRMTSADHFQDVRHLVLAADKEIPAYRPGDVAALMPRNSPRTVSELLTQLGWDDRADVLFWVRPRRPEVQVPLAPTTLRVLLESHLDITAPPRRTFFTILARHVDPHDPSFELHREKLEELQSAHGLDLYLDYVWKARRTPLEVLRDFPLWIPPDLIFDLFPRLRAREFSISSAHLTTPQQIHITAALVRYQTFLPAPRVGVCSRWIEGLVPHHSEFCLSIRPGSWTLVDTDRTPLVLVAAGTGVAPMRAIIQHCSQASPLRKMYLFFGCRYLQKDFIFAEEWASYSNLSVFALGSRDLPGRRRHIDVLLQQHVGLVRRLVLDDHATVFVAGNAKLPGLVKTTLAEICDDPQLPSLLQRTRRLQIEAWS